MNRSPAPQNRDLVGQRLFGDYQIVRKLGEGGMGAVYLARQDAIQQNIAIKVLHGQAAESREIVERFNREARVISMLTHPNIIRVFIFGRTPDDLMYMAMEYVEGHELREDLHRGPVDELVAIKIVKQMCSALAEAHDLDIIHRDLKPDNVLLTNFRGEQNFVKILDFGIAKITNNPEEKQLTQAGIVYGTPEYLSPEQAQAKDLDHRTDIYSLGVMLYECMTGQVPFQSSSAVEVLTQHVFNEPEKPSTIAPGRVSPTMENIILKAMAKDPDDRFQSALDMFRSLVMREQEILQERSLDSGAAYVPGGELTGMFTVVGGEQAAGTPVGQQQGQGGGPAPQRPGGPQQQFAGGQQQMQGENNFPMQQQSQNYPTGQTGPGTGQHGHHGSMMPGQSNVPAPGDKTRTMMIAVIVVAGLVLLFLVAVIIALTIGA